MKISAMTIVRNGTKLGLPFQESIRSILPLCDEYVVVVGRSDDDTREQVAALGDSRVRIVDTEWSQQVVPRKNVLAQQTNIGLHLCTGDWVVCLQANEILHECALDPLRALMQEHVRNQRVEALLFERLTFWGDYAHVLRTYPDRYKYTARVVRPYIGTYSIRDAMSFAVFDRFSTRGRYPRSLDTGLDMYRYGFIGPPERIVQKDTVGFHRNGHRVEESKPFFYTTHPKRFVVPFTGTHPSTMQARIAEASYQLDEASPHWRTRLTSKEWGRWLETRLYEQIGLPAWRSPRYRLRGSFTRKDRTAQSGVGVQ